jgi:acetyltransferase-like isoleucine patch superfamily enzyme
MLLEVIKKIRFWKNADRIGPDIPGTHWKLFFKSSMITLCKKKFYYFDDSAEIRPGAYVIGCSQISIGKNVIIRPETQLHGETTTLDISIIIEDDVLIGSGVHIYVENHNFSDSNTPIYYQGHSPSQQVIIRKGSWIGANAIILPGVEIGENTVVGAGSLVTRSFPKGVVLLGNPAKIIKDAVKV